MSGLVGFLLRCFMSSYAEVWSIMSNAMLFDSTSLNEYGLLVVVKPCKFVFGFEYGCLYAEMGPYLTEAHGCVWA